jgi:hypothetical protein
MSGPEGIMNPRVAFFAAHCAGLPFLKRLSVIQKIRAILLAHRFLLISIKVIILC